MILVGLSGAGKTTAAREAAALLGAPWCDLDQRIEARAGANVAELFAALGEAGFRELERREMIAVMAEPPQLVASGGGWAAQEGNLAAVQGAAFIIYLSLTPVAAAARLAGQTDRPLLGQDDLQTVLVAQLAAREAWYRLADIEVAVGEAAVEDVAAAVAVAAREHAGWQVAAAE